MSFHQAVVAVLRALLFAGLAIAYASAGIGAARLIDAGTASKFILIGAFVAFIAMLFYFVISDLELRRRLHRQLSTR